MKRLSLLLLSTICYLLSATPALADEPIIGEIRAYVGTSVPAGWVRCDGGYLSQTTYASLYAVVGGTYGSAPPGQFVIPDCQGKNLVGVKSGDINFGQLGFYGGEKTHTLTIAEMPSHTHTQNAHNHTVNGNVNAAAGSAIRALAPAGSGSNNVSSESATATNQNTGGGQSHNVLDPYTTVYFIIYTGVGAPTPTPTATPLATYTPAPTYTPVPPAPTYTPWPTYTPVSYTSTTYLPNISASYTHTLRSGKTLTQPVEVTFGQLIVSSLGLAVVAALVLPFVFGVVFKR